LSPGAIGTPPLLTHLEAGAGVVAGGGCEVGGVVVAVVVVAGRVVVVVVATVGGGGDGAVLPPKKGSWARRTNPSMEGAEVSGRQSQRPASAR
jgi:hypothetical protein